MSETVDWKQKYRDSLIEMEAEEVRWKHAEQVLRRLVGRLCAAGMGVNLQLDDQLIALAAANRRNADADELARLADSLTKTVVAVDATSPVPTITFPVTDLQTRLAVKALLEQLAARDPKDPSVPALLAELVSARNDHTLAKIITRAADLIQAHGDELRRERLRTAAILAEVTKRLDEMAGYLSESHHANRSHFEDTQTYNDTVMSQMRELTDEVGGAAAIGQCAPGADCATCQRFSRSRRISASRSQRARRPDAGAHR